MLPCLCIWAALYALVITDFGWIAPLGGAVVSLAVCLYFPKKRYARYACQVTAHSVETVEGAWWVKETLVPIDRIHQLQLVRTPMDTLAGTQSLLLYTAGSTAKVRYLEPAQAKALADHLHEALRAKLANSEN